MTPAIFFDEYEIRDMAEKYGAQAMILQQTAIKFCRTWQTDMPHTHTSQGWICACGELWISEEADARLSRPIV